MGGPGSGGTRSGAPGRAYSNRSDLNTRKVPVQTARGQPYGAAGEQRKSQSIVPLASPAPPTPALAPATPQTGIPGAPPSSPRASIPLDAPTARPDEPVTSGLSIGPGAGPESLFAAVADPTSLELRALYALFPNNDLLSLIEELDQGLTK